MSNQITESQIIYAYNNLRNGNGTDALTRIAKQCDQKTFVACIQQNELPPVKLSQADMDLIKGGGLLQDFCDWVRSKVMPSKE